MQAIEEEIQEITKESGADEYMATWEHKLDATYITVTYNWAGGADFCSLLEDNPDMFEGSVIRTFRRTEEVMRQVARAAKEMNESDLQVAILEGITLIRRDIVFNSSLYV
jgi:ATP-dependent RNA helicase DOB1